MEPVEVEGSRAASPLPVLAADLEERQVQGGVAHFQQDVSAGVLDGMENAIERHVRGAVRGATHSHAWRRGRAEERSSLREEEAWRPVGDVVLSKLVAERTTREPEEPFLMAQGQHPPPQPSHKRSSGRQGGEQGATGGWWERGRGRDPERGGARDFTGGPPLHSRVSYLRSGSAAGRPGAGTAGLACRCSGGRRCCCAWNRCRA